MCSVHCPQDLLLFAKIEVIKIETCKIWPIIASAQLLRAPLCILKQPTLKEMAPRKIQPLFLNRAKKEAISKILFSQYCHQAWIKWDQYRRERTSGWTSADTCVWYTQVENCLKCKRFILPNQPQTPTVPNIAKAIDINSWWVPVSLRFTVFQCIQVCFTETEIEINDDEGNYQYSHSAFFVFRSRDGRDKNIIFASFSRVCHFCHWIRWFRPDGST